ncbi:hypothetical protein [Arthrobacter sp. NEB 688]|uniref:hypothetical protein n=1 Tax=Arthrobacter sp. NEB 688 TaxID=904039 RepID=UPI0015659E3F|nr:hypothetical protein [Arthrobacter sp. NEB 688]QKE82891.1 hypothetical protein HL663_02275 [Arthrobacter sp. NEB 688]
MFTLAAITLAGCGSGSEPKEAATAAAPAASQAAPKDIGTITASGFGQADEYVWATAVVHNNSDNIGQTVTVSFNILGDAGEILGSESQVESFSQPSADHIIGTQISLEPGQKAAKVEATLDVEASGTFSDQPFPAIPVSDLKITGTGDHRDVSFVITNPLTIPIKDPRIALACKDKSGKLIGGDIAFPELVPAGGKIKVDTSPIVSGDPADCSVYVGPPVDWEGAPEAVASASPSATTAAEPAGSAESAFRTWVTQFGERDWKSQYETLVGPQQELLTQREFIACRTAEAPPKITWSKALGATDVGDSAIPGTKTKLPATKVDAQLNVDGLKVPIDAHMFIEDGVWKWSLEKEALAKCTS